jgi:hypothetical protein
MLIQLVWQNPQIIKPIVGENLAFVEQHLRQDRVARKFLHELLMRYATWSNQGRAPAELTA